MFSGKSGKPSSKIDTLVGVGTRIEGDIVFSGGLRVDGTIRGNVTADPAKPSTLTLTESATIEGRIEVAHLIANGAITGSVVALESCELQPSARITGDIDYGSVEIHLGAVVHGHLRHHGQNVAAKTGSLKLAASNT